MNKSIIRNIIIFLGEVFLIFFAFYITFYENIFDYYIFLKALNIFILIIIYKHIGHMFGIAKPIIGKIDAINEEKTIDLFNNKIVKFINRKIFNKFPWLLDIIFFLFIFFPFYWLNAVVLIFYCKFYDIQLIINSNKDIFFLKHFNKVYNHWYVNYSNIYFTIVKWVLLYPFLRFLLFPKYIRERIFSRYTYIEIARLRFLGYCYSIIFFLYGYYEYIYYFSFSTKIMLIYIYFAIIMPFFMYLNYFFKNSLIFEDYIFPSIHSFVFFDRTSLWLHLFAKFVDNVNKHYDNRFFFKYGYVSHLYNLWYLKSSTFTTTGLNSFFNELPLEYKWKYEKSYGISLLVYRNLIKFSGHDRLYHINVIFNKYENEFGNNSLISYVVFKKNAQLIYKFWCFLLIDVRRMLCYEMKDWLYSPKSDYDLMYWNTDEVVVDIINDINNFDNIPNTYRYRLRLYNKLLYYSLCFSTSSFSSQEVISFDESSNSMLCQLARINGYTDVFDYNFEVIVLEKDTSNVSFSNNVVYLEALSNKFFKEYLLLYSKFEKDSNVLISDFVYLELKERGIIKY